MTEAPGGEGTPAVSLCIPTYNSARWIDQSLGSALAQTETDLEILVVDNASTDDTLQRVRSYNDPRVRLERNPQNLGAVRNFNRCLDLAAGEYVKFLMSDDVLYPDCVARMLALFRREPRLGLVFSRRDILMPEDAGPAAHEWAAQARDLHRSFRELHEVNSGPALFEQYLEGGLRGNWIGEPTCVMVRADAFRHAGPFNPWMCQEVDYAMWLRLLPFTDVGFIDQPLCAFRANPDALTSANKRIGKDWLDLLWLMQDLLSYPEVIQRWPEVKRLRDAEARRVLRAEVGGVLRRALGQKRPTLPLSEKIAGLRAFFKNRDWLVSSTASRALPVAKSPTPPLQ